MEFNSFELDGADLVSGPLRRLARHKRTSCMNCGKKPRVAAHWANGHGMAWFCIPDFMKWAEEDDRDIVGVWYLEDGEMPNPTSEIKKTPKGTDKVRKLEEKLSLKEIHKRLTQRHYGPGPHPGTGTEQAIHGKGNGFKGVDAVEIRITGFYSGQTNGTILVGSEDRSVTYGWLDFQQFEDEVLIAWMEVNPEYRRRGVATRLVKELKKEWPDKKIVWGMMTGEGSALRENLIAQGIVQRHGVNIGHEGKPEEDEKEADGAVVERALDKFMGLLERLL